MLGRKIRYINEKVLALFDPKCYKKVSKNYDCSKQFIRIRKYAKYSYKKIVLLPFFLSIFWWCTFYNSYNEINDANLI